MSEAGTALAGQVGIVTGAGRGIGKAIALALAREGMAVMLAARTRAQLEETAAEIRAAGGRAAIFSGDLSEAIAATALASATERSLGAPDLLVNNAGTTLAEGSFWNVPPQDWWRVLEVNLRGPMVCSHAVLGGMVARRRGRVVNVASGTGARPYQFTAYGVSKAAVFRLTDALARQTRPFGVLVIAIGPGIVQTELSRTLERSGHWRPPAEFARPEMAAGLVVRIARGDADALSGRFLHAGWKLDDVLARASEVEREELYQLRLVQLDRELDALEEPA